MTASMTPFTLRRHGNDHVALTFQEGWHTYQLTLDRVWAANLAAELDAWLAGTDQIPEVDYPTHVFRDVSPGDQVYVAGKWHTVAAFHKLVDDGVFVVDATTHPGADPKETT
jgi:hypothetical protein